MKKNVKLIIFYVILFAVILLIAFSAFGKDDGDEKVYSDIQKLFDTEQVRRFEVTKKNIVNIETKSGDVVSYKLRDFSVFYKDFESKIKEQCENGIIESYEYEPLQSTPWWVSIIPSILLSFNKRRS